MSSYGFARIATAIPFCKVADVKHNCNEIINLIKNANSQNVKIVVFPELAITGYSCADLFFTNTLLDGTKNGLNDILNATKDIDIISIIGMPLSVGPHLHNCAVVIQKGEILGIIPKTYIPNYGEFYERRWFYPSTDCIAQSIIINNKTVPITTNLIFNNDDIHFAIEICEDLWVSTPPSSMHAINGANLIFNLSASNCVIGKKNYRRTLVKNRSFSSHCAYIFVSAGMGESTTDTLFSGHTLIAENGSILMENSQNTFEGQLFIAEIDIERLETDRRKLTTFHTHLNSPEYKFIETTSIKSEIETLHRKISKFPFVPRTSHDKDERMEEIYQILATSLARRLLHTTIKHPVVGISGGLDSTLALLVIIKAMDILKLPHENIIGVTMPGFGTTSRTLENAKKLMQLLKTTSKEISINDACIQHFKDIEHDINTTDVTYENSQARERTQILMDIANKNSGMVVGTGDLSELALGWATYAGDHISMYGVNNGVPKTLVRHLVGWIADNIGNDEIKDVLYDILDTPVSPELLPADEDGKISQKTEDILGDYILHDFFLYYFLRFGFTPEKILFLAVNAFKEDYTVEEIKKVLKTFFARFFNNQFKRSCMPDGPKIGSITLSPRSDLRMPSDACVNLWLENQ